jgi:hypothetical protein
MRRPLTIALFISLLAPAAANGTELRAHGLLDLVLSSGDEARYTNLHTQGDSNFDPYRVHLFVDAKVSPTLDVYLETILHEGYMPIVADGAYAQWTPWADRDAHLEAGKVPWPIGTWAARTYSDRNPLVGMPLMYQYHTSLAWNALAADADELVASAGAGQAGLDYADGVTGMPVVDDRWWDVGAVVLGSQRPFEYAFGVLQGSPGWPVTTVDDTPGQTLLGRIGLLPSPGVRVGASAAWGTWMPDWFSFRLPPGKSPRDYHEGLAMGDLELSRGPWELRSEAFLKQWETSTAGTLHLHGGYAEGRLGVGDGGWLAARYDVLRFADVTTSAGVRRPWDDAVDRLEACAGYRVSRDLRLKAAFQRDILHPFGAKDVTRDLYALSASIRL